MSGEKRPVPNTPTSVHIVDATMGPLAGDGRLNRIIPFAATAILSMVVAVPLTTWTRPGLALAGSVLIAVTILGSALVPWHRIPPRAQVASPLLFLIATMLLSMATGQAVGSPFVSMIVLPLMWLAIYGDRIDVLCAAMLAAIGLWLAVSSEVVAPGENGTAFTLVLVVCCAGMGITLHGLVAHARELALSLREHQLAFEYLSLHDPLTDLSNRRGFAAQSRAASDRAVNDRLPFSLLYIDLDQFKELNDALGHDVGDALLREVAERLRSMVRATDTVARLGGDEFAVLIEGSDPAHANVLAERIEAALKLPYDAAPTTPFSASVGVAHSIDAGTEAEAVLAAADSSMFARKRDQHRAHGLGAGTGSWHADEHP